MHVHAQTQQSIKESAESIFALMDKSTMALFWQGEGNTVITVLLLKLLYIIITA